MRLLPLRGISISCLCACMASVAAAAVCMLCCHLLSHALLACSHHFFPAVICTGSQDRTAKVWRLPNLVLSLTLKGHKRGIWAVAFSPVDQAVATASGEHPAVAIAPQHRHSHVVWVPCTASVSCRANHSAAFLACLCSLSLPPTVPALLFCRRQDGAAVKPGQRLLPALAHTCLLANSLL